MSSIESPVDVAIGPPPRDASVGVQLRYWRERRRMSQLGLATTSAVSTRHLSYVETGRSKPSRELIEHLAERLDVPLRERNHLLLAAGYAPRFPETGFDADEMRAVRAAVEQVITAHDPYPAVVVDGRWDLVAANESAMALLTGVDPQLLEPPVNVVRISLHPDGMAPNIKNFDEYASHLVDRIRRQVEQTADPALAALLEEISGYARRRPGGVAPLLPSRPHPDLVLPLVFDAPIGELRLFSTISTFGAPLDVTVSELAIEAFYPSDDHTRALLTTSRP